MSQPHYLEAELLGRLKADSNVFHFLEQGSLDGVWFWDLTDPEHEWLSPKFCEVFGYKPGEIPHTSTWWQDNIHPEDLEKALVAYDAHAADPEHPYDVTVRYRHKTGRTIWVRCRGLILRDDEGVPNRMLGTHTNVTEFMEKAEELRRSNADLKQFAYVASHDLQEPLRMIGNFTGLLMDALKTVMLHLPDERPDDLQKAVMTIDTSEKYVAGGVQQMGELIDDLLRFSRTGVELAHDLVPLQRIVRMGLRPLHLLMQEREVELNITGGDLPVWGDKGALQTLFQNLASNAIKFTKDRQPRLHVHAELSADGGDLLIQFKDNGIGIDEKYLSRIFDPFFRLHSRQTYPGTGIGLALCRKVVAAHKGSLSVEESTPEGTTFLIRLPSRDRVFYEALCSS